MLSAHPVSFLWDGERLRFSTLKGRQKIRNLQADPRISLCIVDPENDLHYLEIRGQASLEEALDRSFINSIAHKYLNVDEYPYDRPDAERITVTIHVEQASTTHGPRQASEITHWHALSIGALACE